ncbi:unnamed protein product [Litomosoides sigmodontis]|uniref:Uncharacterized protein n=1 Tax=Litomosoides sigmodontis TaxID=42156 RepID=A0A3P6TDQ4_LITSI|nr:unnamed protein product [Litomosoides sigmodontis]
MEEMRRRARVERTFLRHSNRESQGTVNGGNSLGSRDYASSHRITSPIIASRIFCRSQICLRKWLGGRLRGSPPSSSSVTTTSNTTGTETATTSSIATSENPQQISTDCASSRSTLIPMSSVAASNDDTSKCRRPETSSDTVTAEQEKDVDNSGDNSNKVDSSSTNEQRIVSGELSRKTACSLRLSGSTLLVCFVDFYN